MYIRDTCVNVSRVVEVAAVLEGEKSLISQVFIEYNATSHLNNWENLSIEYMQQSESI